jgi:hypothetical protein
MTYVLFNLQGVVLSEDDITDEAGNMLGGKRAAMQFAHNKVNIAQTTVL